MNLKRINGGEFRTLIMIKLPPVKTSASGVTKRDNDNAVNIFGEGVKIPCKWDDKPYNRSYKMSSVVDGAESSRDFIYAIINYNDKVGYDCKVWKDGEDKPYDIVNICNIAEKNRYLELQLRRVINNG